MLTEKCAGLFIIVQLVCVSAQIILPRTASADDCAACEQFLKFVPQYSLAENVTLIGAAVIHQDGHQFSVDAELADALRRKVQEDTRIPPQCQNYVKSSIHIGPRITVTASGIAGGQPAGFSMSSDYPKNLMSMFNSMVASYDPCKRPVGAASNTSYVACLAANANKAYQKFTTNLANGTTQQIITRLGKLGTIATASDIALLKAYNAALNSGSIGGLTAWAAGPGKQLSTDQFLTVVQMTGFQMNASYNHPRADHVGAAGKGIITPDQALASMKTNTIFMITGNSGDPGASLADFEIICNDAAITQVKMLAARGFPNSFAISYRSATGGHTDVITQDPNDPLKL